jgi:hypothetical protein
VVEVVLDGAVHGYVEGVVASAEFAIELVGWAGGDGDAQVAVGLLEAGEGFLPGGVAGVGNLGEVFAGGEGGFLSATNALGGDAIPGGDVQDEFPDGVGAGDGTGGGLWRGDAAEKEFQRWSVPRFAGIGAAGLIGDTSGFAHGQHLTTATRRKGKRPR